MNKITLRKKKRRIIIGLVFLFFILIFMDIRLRPIVKNVASGRARTIVNQVVNESILEDMSVNQSDYFGIIDLHKNSDGEVLAIFSNMEKINKLKAHVSLLIQEKLNNLKSKDLNIAIGTLTGIDILNGRGPCIPFNISSSGSIISDFESDFSSSGINQSIHRMNLHIKIKIGVMIPGCSHTTDVDTKILISETVVVGRVPHYYSIPESLEISDVVNDD